MMLDNYFKQTKTFESTADKSMSWLESHDEIRKDIDKTLSGFNELLFAIPIFGGSGDKYTEIHPWHHLFFEAEQDLDSAILLLLTGFYKDSFRSLRSFLELHIFALYSFVNEDKNNFQDWLEGKTQTPKIYILLQTLNDKSEDFKTLNKKLKWDEEIKLLYKELSGFMHTQGALHTHTSLRNSNQTVFSETGLQAGTSLLLRAIRLAGMGFVVNFPMSFQPLPLFEKFAFNQPAGGFLDENQVERIRNIFSNETSSKLSQICLSNENSNSLAEGIKSMYDLSEEEIVESLKKTIGSEEFAKSRKDILRMIQEDKINEAFAYVRAMQGAMMRTITMVLFNPFYDTSVRK